MNNDKLLKANELEPVVSKIEAVETDLEHQVRVLLGRAQVIIAVVLVIPQLLIMFGALELANGLEPLSALASLVAVQVALFTNHQLDTRAGLRLAVDALQKIDFEDNRIDQGIDFADGLLTTVGQAQPPEGVGG